MAILAMYSDQEVKRLEKIQRSLAVSSPEEALGKALALVETAVELSEGEPVITLAGPHRTAAVRLKPASKAELT